MKEYQISISIDGENQWFPVMARNKEEAKGEAEFILKQISITAISER